MQQIDAPPHALVHSRPLTRCVVWAWCADLYLFGSMFVSLYHTKAKKATGAKKSL
jgi:hypothetical protein